MNRYVMHIIRILLGVIFFSAGVNGFIVFWGMESLFPTSNEAMILFQFDYLLIVEKTIEVLCGVFLLLNRYVPLAVASLLPIIVNIFLLHVFVDPSLLILAIILIIFEVYLLIYFRGNFIQLFEKKSSI
ncbi:DoxX family membrane protein [Ureibacillus galli]|nr:DoxX family membrane protein [Ureibacillus galli]